MKLNESIFIEANQEQSNTKRNESISRMFVNVSGFNSRSTAAPACRRMFATRWHSTLAARLLFGSASIISLYIHQSATSRTRTRPNTCWNKLSCRCDLYYHDELFFINSKHETCSTRVCLIHHPPPVLPEPNLLLLLSVGVRSS